MKPKRPPEPPNTRTLRRLREQVDQLQKLIVSQHEEDREFLGSVALHTRALVKHVERLVAEKHALERANETLRQVPTFSGWTREQEASLIAGLSDAALRRAAIEAQEDPEGQISGGFHRVGPNIMERV